MALENLVDGTMLNKFAKLLKSNIKSDLLGDKRLKYMTQAEYDLLTDEEKNDENIVYNITDSDIIEGFSGDYNDLTNKPIIPTATTVTDNLTSTSTTAALSANQGFVLKGLVDTKADMVEDTDLQTMLTNIFGD